MHSINCLCLIILTIFVSCQNREKDKHDWVFQVSDRIQSTPIVDDGIVYFGSNDSNFYAVDMISGKEIWRIKTRHQLRSQGVIKDSLIYISGGNDMFALNKYSGQQIWIYQSPDTSNSGVLDPWDYHQASPIINNSEVFCGFGNGEIIGFDLKNGKKIFRYQSLDSSPIRSTPVIMNDVVYFGDWHGRIYAVDIRNGDTIWRQRTYETQHYPTFGQINTKLIIHDTLLIFGARNPELQALHIKTGQKVWLFIQEDGGWISGDPIVQGDTLYIGGSDNHEMFAMDVKTGKMFWRYEFLFNNFSQPIIKNNYIFFTTGDAYAFMPDNPGNGYLYVLNKNDGTIKNMAHFNGNIFTSPVISDGKIIFGGDDNSLRSLDYEKFIKPSFSFPENGSGPVNNMEVVYDTIENIILFSFEMRFQAPLSVSVRTFEGEQIRMLFNGEQASGNHSLKWDCKNEKGDYVQDGYYIIQSKSGIFIKNKFAPFKNS